MTVMEPRKRWTDERLDDLNKKVEALGTKVDGLENKVDGGFARLERCNHDLRTEMNQHLGELIARFDAQSRTMLGAAAVIIAALIGTNALF
jgi:hypothetical protein